MKVSEIARLLDAKVLCGGDMLDIEIDSAFGSDMMSDVLAFVNGNAVLLTGLINTHVIRTAELLDVRLIVFVRGKPVPTEIIESAIEENMILLATDDTLYITCGKLYAAGLKGCTR